MNRISFITHMMLGTLLLLSACVFDPVEGPTPRQVYSKYYGDPGSNEMIDMIVNQNGNVLLLGGQRRSDGNTSDIIIIETDTVGNEINTLVIDVGPLLADTAYHTDEYPRSIKEVDGGYLVVSTFAEVIDGNPQQTNIFWAMLDQNLEIIGIDTASAGLNNLEGNDIMQTADGHVVVVGTTDQQEENDLTRNARKQYFLIKKYVGNLSPTQVLDSTLWRKSYGYPGSDDKAIFVSELPDGNIGLVGSTEQSGFGGASGNNVGVMILNPLATSPVSDEIFGITVDGQDDADDIPNNVVHSNESFIIVGTSTRGETVRPFLMTLRESGPFVASRALESRWGLNATGRGVTITRENDLIVTGSYIKFLVDESEAEYAGLNRDKNGEVLFMRTGQTGIERDEYENNFGLVSGNDIGEVVVTLPGGSIAIGATIDFGSNQTMMSFMKLNDKGSLQRQ